MKKWYQSKTVITGVIAVGIAVLEALESGGDYKTAAFAGLGVIMVILRAVTTEGLEK